MEIITNQKQIRYPNQIIIQKGFFEKNIIAIEKKKTQIFMNKPVYIGLSIL